MRYIVMRLTTGEQVMATFVSEDATHLNISHPLIVKMTHSIEDGRMIERVTAQPFCQFSDDKYYDIPKSSVMFVKSLHHALVDHYIRIVKSYEETVLVRPPDQERKLNRNEKEMTADDFKEKIDRLSDFLQSASDEPDDGYEVTIIDATIIEGNDTIH